MNSLVTSQFPFPLEPVFKAYENTSTYYYIASPERVIDHYDSVVLSKIQESSIPAPPSLNVNELYLMERDRLQLIEQEIGMWPLLTIENMAHVFHHFRLVHVDHWDNFHHLPFKEVW